MKRTAISIAAIVLCAMLFAQSNVLPLTGQAAREYQNKEYLKAKELIDQSIAGEGGEDAYTWQVRGHIYKEIFKQMENENINSPAREAAVNSFIECMKLDTENKYLEWNSTSLRFLASTFWNDAVNIMERRERKRLSSAAELYDKYHQIMSQARPKDNLDKFSIDFYRAYATANRKTIEELRAKGAEPDDYAPELQRVEESYQKALKLKADDYGSNYNYAINLYNEAAYRIGKIPAEADLTYIMLEQAGCIEIFKQALPIAKNAENLRPGRIEILKALRAIHLSLSNYDEFDRYNKLVREKQGELIIDSKTERELKRKYFIEEKTDE
ncbi:MAG: hypothetical protein HKN45_06240 [Flavobacteriales bacterium]|nr:hypothetical protein [Flavobacteriales bacterium]